MRPARDSASRGDRDRSAAAGGRSAEPPRRPTSALLQETSVNRAHTSTQPTVLLVEDDADNRLIYQVILEYAGYRVLEAGNGAEGIRLAREDRPDVILMDVSLPLIDGWQATGILKADPGTRRIPIIAVTAHALDRDRAKAMEVGCDGYLPKPVAPRAVVEEVRRWTGRDRLTRRA
jgi:two-component system, cell cycle response regulator DivK